MRPYLEHISFPSDASWVLFDRKLKRIPFEWHYNSEYELTLTLNSEGQRFIGDNISPYKHGDLVLMGPKLPHTWCSSPESHNGQTHRAIVLWLSEKFVSSLIEPHIELRPAQKLLLRAGRGLTFSAFVTMKAASLIVGMLGQTPGARFSSLIELLLLLASDPKPMVLASPRAEHHRWRGSPRKELGVLSPICISIIEKKFQSPPSARSLP